MMVTPDLEVGQKIVDAFVDEDGVLSTRKVMLTKVGQTAITRKGTVHLAYRVEGVNMENNTWVAFIATPEKSWKVVR